MPHDADMKIIMKELVKVMQKIQTNSENIGESLGGRSSNIQDIQLQPYDESHETFTTYLQRLDNYLEIRGLNSNTLEANNQKVKILINCLGSKTYRTLTSLTAPDLPSKKPFETLTKLLKDHLDPQASEIAERHKFLLRIQHEGESIANFVADLKMYTTYCHFVCTSCKKSTNDTHLRSQFIRGKRDNDIRERLLQQKEDVIFAKVVELALAIETSKLESRKNNYNLHDGCILHGIKVVIPTILRYQVLQELHVGHMRISKMKALARSYCFWRGIDSTNASACRRFAIK
jgi:hypothetical protein